MILTFWRRCARRARGIRRGWRSGSLAAGNRFRPALEICEDRMLLTTFLVTDLGDRGLGSGLQGDLRYTITRANLNSEPSNRIAFQPGLSGTITLGGQPLTIMKDLEIDGPGADQVTISGNHRNRVFTIPDQQITRHVALADLTIADGTIANTDGTGGGGIYDYRAALTLTRCVFSGNTASGRFLNGGGAIYSEIADVTLNASSLIRNQAVQNDGGGIYSGGALTLVDSVVAENSSSIAGGGILAAGSRFPASQLTLIRSTVVNNSAAFGGGVSSSYEPTTIQASTISGNRAFTDGGGLSVGPGLVTITDSTIADNRVDIGSNDGFGGAISAVQPALTITRSTLSGNSARIGGAIMISGAGTLNMEDATISGNTATMYGGGIALGSLQIVAEFTSCTITGNSANGTDATAGGGGLWVKDDPGGTVRALVWNSIVAGNQAVADGPDVRGAVISLGYNLVGVTDGGTGWNALDRTGTATDSLDPLLGPLADNGGPTLTHGLQAGSPALQVGDRALIGTFDQRGTKRPDVADIGAVQEGPLARFQVDGPDQWIAGAPFTITVTALDAYGNVVNSFAGQTIFQSSDAAAGLPDSYTFTAADLGSQSFTATLNTAGSQTIRVATANQQAEGVLNVEVVAGGLPGRSLGWWFEMVGRHSKSASLSEPEA